MEWFNFYGLAIIIIILVPNVIYAIRGKTNFEDQNLKKAVSVLEQIGRYGCMAFMIFNVPFLYLDFWFKNALTVYLSVNGTLCLLYLLFWVICWKRNNMLKAISLSVIPSCIFLFSGILLANFPLIMFSTIFAVTHIYISCRNTTYFENVKRKPKEKRTLPPWSEIVSEMYDKGLPTDSNGERCCFEVIYSRDLSRRVVIVKSAEKNYSYYFEKLTAFDEEELQFLAPNQYPAMWLPNDVGGKSVFDDITLLKSELKSTPLYKQYFED